MPPPLKTVKKFLLILLLVGVIGGGFAFWRSRAASKVTPADEKPQFVTACKRDITQTYKATGNIVPATSTEIRSEATGTITKLLVRPGDQVSVGQPLLELDQSEIVLHIEEAKLEIEAAKLRLQKAKQDRDRRATLMAHQYVNEKELKDAETDVLLGENALQTQEAHLRTLQNQLTKTALSAPYAGVILELQARPGMVVTGAQAGREGTVLMTIADLSKLKVEAAVNEVDVAQFSQNMPVKLTFDSARGITISGTVDFISPSASSKAQNRGGGDSQGSSQSGSHNFPVEISFVSTDPRIRPGMTANIEATLSSVTQAVSVEVSAIFVDGKDTVVFLRDGHGAALTKRVVTVGINDNKFAEVKDGLKPGEIVNLTRPPRKPSEKEESRGGDADI